MRAQDGLAEHRLMITGPGQPRPADPARVDHGVAPVTSMHTPVNADVGDRLDELLGSGDVVLAQFPPPVGGAWAYHPGDIGRQCGRAGELLGVLEFLLEGNAAPSPEHPVLVWVLTLDAGFLKQVPEPLDVGPG